MSSRQGIRQAVIPQYVTLLRIIREKGGEALQHKGNDSAPEPMTLEEVTAFVAKHTELGVKTPYDKIPNMIAWRMAYVGQQDGYPYVTDSGLTFLKANGYESRPQKPLNKPASAAVSSFC